MSFEFTNSTEFIGDLFRLAALVGKRLAIRGPSVDVYLVEDLLRVHDAVVEPVNSCAHEDWVVIQQGFRVDKKSVEGPLVRPDSDRSRPVIPPARSDKNTFSVL